VPRRLHALHCGGYLNRRLIRRANALALPDQMHRTAVPTASGFLSDPPWM